MMSLLRKAYKRVVRWMVQRATDIRGLTVSLARKTVGPVVRWRQERAARAAAKTSAAPNPTSIPDDDKPTLSEIKEKANRSWFVPLFLVVMGLLAIGYGAFGTSKPSTRPAIMLVAFVMVLGILFISYRVYKSRYGKVEEAHATPPVVSASTSTATVNTTEEERRKPIQWGWWFRSVLTVLIVLLVANWTWRSIQTWGVDPSASNLYLVRPEPSLLESSQVVKKFVVKAGQPIAIGVPRNWRWDIVKPIPEGWSTGNGTLDKKGNRIQVFETLPSFEEVVLEIAITKCTTRKMCEW